MDRRQSSRDALYESYATTHAGTAGRTSPTALQEVVRRLPDDRRGPVVDLGCGQGALVAAMRAAGYTRARGIDVSPEQVAIARQSGIDGVEQGDVLEVLSASPGQFLAITATDFFEHLTREELLVLLPQVRAALRDGGVLVGRVPNAVSPFGGNYRHGDFTHESWFTARSVRQLMAVAGFAGVDVYPSAPAPHGVVSALRRLVWTFYSGFFKLGLAAETGVLRGNIVTQNLVFVARRGPGSPMTA
ncbi:MULTISPECIES: class I SAM-dependent DNA methyltransferase [unclassified Geodermatophilus]|uniref:class I SAM-dependent DNA methyltransferase n=1 Tax=unclassified Geodermatophilus TaxID=2637632 RepID=UPI003EE90760